MAREEQHHRRADSNWPNPQENMIPAAIVEPADRPEEVLLHLLFVENREDGRRTRGEEHPHHNAREEQCHDRDSSVAHGERYGQPHGEHRSDKGKGREQEHARCTDTETDGEHGTDRCPARHADDAGIGEWIAEDPLEHRPRYAQPGADHQADERARQTDVQKNGLLFRCENDMRKDGQSHGMSEVRDDVLRTDVILSRAQRQNDNRSECSNEPREKNTLFHCAVLPSAEVPRITRRSASFSARFSSASV